MEKTDAVLPAKENETSKPVDSEEQAQENEGISSANITRGDDGIVEGVVIKSENDGEDYNLPEDSEDEDEGIVVHAGRLDLQRRTPSKCMRFNLNYNCFHFFLFTLIFSSETASSPHFTYQECSRRYSYQRPASS